jgi:pimeloyl-ACP methyl ester carboxylesterase
MSIALQWSGKPCRSVFSWSLLGLTALILGLAIGLSATPLLAQDKDKTEEKTEDKTEKKADDDKPPPPPPEPEEKVLVTDEDPGVEIKATYYPGNKGRESIPVILLHGFNRKEGRKEVNHSRKDFTQEQGLAPYLQSTLGCAVIVPDLRGYGESTSYKKTGDETEKRDDKKRPADAAKEKKKAEELKKKFQGQVPEMVEFDLRAVKDFLWKKNNKKALNLCKLTVIGVEEGGSLALSYAAYDSIGYEQQQPQVGPLKLGRFVKTVVLISPLTKFRGSMAQKAMKLTDIHRDLSVMIVAGNKNEAYLKDAEQLNNLFKKARPPEDELKVASRTLFFFPNVDTELQGCKLLDESSLNVPAKIAKFMKLRLVDNIVAKDKWGWRELKLPHQ